MIKTEYENSQINKNRENIYRFLSRLFEKEISAPLLDKMKKMDFPEGVLADGASKIKQYLADNTMADQEEALAADYAGIFLGAGETNGKAAYPFASVYTSKEGLIMQEEWQELKTIYEEKGLTLSAASADIKEDHIAMELQYMAYLCSEKGTETEQREFLEKHLLNWTNGFLKDVENYAGTSFYQGLAEMTAAFLKEEAEYLENMEVSEKISYILTYQEMDEILQSLTKKYKIYAPCLSDKKGVKGKVPVRYGEISSVNDIVIDQMSDFSAKEVYYPILQTMFYFTEKECKESTLEDDRDYLLFLHACDINAIRRLDNIFINNGGKSDLYYERRRKKVKIILLECGSGFENCFCVSMGSNTTEQYDMAVRIQPQNICVQVKTRNFKEYFEGRKSSEYEPTFVKENQKKVVLPVIENMEDVKKAGTLEYWNKFDGNCIGCGGCNTVCPTCSCFDTIDVIYDESSREGERRRVWSSCMLDSFTMTAGGNRARKTAGANMRFKALHKIYDYRKRFGGEDNMCVGCGRCIVRCPKDISFADTINEFHDALEQSKGGSADE